LACALADFAIMFYDIVPLIYVHRPNKLLIGDGGIYNYKTENCGSDKYVQVNKDPGQRTTKQKIGCLSITNDNSAMFNIPATMKNVFDKVMQKLNAIDVLAALKPDDQNEYPSMIDILKLCIYPEMFIIPLRKKGTQI
jgi:hypothetical protein